MKPYTLPNNWYVNNPVKLGQLELSYNECNTLGLSVNAHMFKIMIQTYPAIAGFFHPEELYLHPLKH